MCESGCRPVVCTSSTRPDTVARRALGVRQPHRPPCHLGFLRLRWVTRNAPVQSPANTHLDCPQHFTLQKNTVVNTNTCACQLLCLCSSLSVCPASITCLSILYHLSSSTVIYLLFPVIYHSSIACYLPIHPSITCLLYHLCDLSSIVYLLCVNYLSIYPASHPSTRPFHRLLVSVIYLSSLCLLLSIIHSSIHLEILIQNVNS